MRTIKFFDSLEELNRFAAEKFGEIARASINSSEGNFTVALSGGSTPKSLYQLLASDEYKNKVDWSKVFFFFGDERNVLPDDTESNFRMAKENLFTTLEISDKNIFRWQTEFKNAEITADNYQSTIRKFYEDNNKAIVTINDCDCPRFDLILLGMGADGHTASLFPFTEALNEKQKMAAANRIEKFDTTRLTLTFPVINNARNVIFLVRGADKTEALYEVLQGNFQPEKYPAQAVKPDDGNLLWLIDSEAARLLN